MPSLPTLSYASNINCPTSESLFADIFATFSSPFFVIFLESFVSVFTTSCTMSLTSRTTCVVLFSGVMCSLPAFTNASANTIAVVVPSPAELAVRCAASFIICIARFSIGSSKKTDAATVTPSLVMVMPLRCSGDSTRTVLPLGPSVLFTAFEILEIPLISLSLPCLSKCRSFGMYPLVDI